jgi:hypothetical protein
MKRLNITIKFEDDIDSTIALDRAKLLISQGYTSGDLNTEGIEGWFEIKKNWEEKDEEK